MLAEDRLNAIVSMVQQAGSVTVPELAEALGVTASTIRRDLQTLDRAHRIAKVHGGATSLERAHVTRDLTLNERSDLHNDDKERICARAAALVEPESFVYIDSARRRSSPSKHLPRLESVTYVTDSVSMLSTLLCAACAPWCWAASSSPRPRRSLAPMPCRPWTATTSTVVFGGPTALPPSRASQRPISRKRK